MIWGTTSNPSAVQKGANYVLGFNEPNFMAQSNLPASVAASLWPTVTGTAQRITNANNPVVKTVSPAVNYCGPASACQDTDPFDYLNNFFAACQGCEVNYIAAHWYGCTADALTSYLTELAQYNKPIWITEFACAQWDPSFQDSVQFQIDYMQQAVQILENDPNVFRYAWFSGRSTGVDNCDILGATGQLTDLGSEYLSQPCGSGPFTAIGDEAIASNSATLGQQQSTSSSFSNPLDIGLTVTLVVLVVVLTAVVIIFVTKSKRKIQERV